jgi:hypothetical protein
MRSKAQERAGILGCFMQSRHHNRIEGLSNLFIMPGVAEGRGEVTRLPYGFPFSVFRFPFSVFRFPFSVFRFPACSWRNEKKPQHRCRGFTLASRLTTRYCTLVVRLGASG